MANVIRIGVENPDELLNSGAYGSGALIRVQSSATESGSYADLTGTGSTPTVALVTATTIYTAYDPVGESTTWYRTRYENSGGTRLSDWQTAFQVGAEEAGGICSLYDVRQRLGLAVNDTSEDENLLDHIRTVTTFIEGRTGRWFVPRPLSGTTTYRMHTESGRALWIPKGIRSITTLGVAEEDQPASGGTYTTATSSDYYIDPPEIERSSGWPATRIVFRRNASGAATIFQDASYGVEITGAFGWSAPPADVANVGANMVVALHRRRGASGGGDSVTVNIDGSRTFEWLLSTTDRRTLDWYAIRTVG